MFSNSELGKFSSDEFQALVKEIRNCCDYGEHSCVNSCGHYITKDGGLEFIWQTHIYPYMRVSIDAHLSGADLYWKHCPLGHDCTFGECLTCAEDGFLKDFVSRIDGSIPSCVERKLEYVIDDNNGTGLDSISFRDWFDYVLSWYYIKTNN